MGFELICKQENSEARAGVLTTEHGQIETPIFMPVGTAGTVKAVHTKDVEAEVKAQIILGNTYHLYLRPGTAILEQAQGLHQFISWDKPILTDSGGYQVYSLSDTRKIKEEGVHFKSHIDGSSHFFSPENVMDIQRSIGADIIMAFDECTPYPCDYDYAKNSMHMTHRWLERCFNHFEKTSPKYGYQQFLIPIIQGSTYPDLRETATSFVTQFEAPIYAIGGLSVGEPAEDMYSMTKLACDILPKEKARYLMGVGTPANILESIDRGIDMFDCVMPTRNGRNGMLFTSEGIINIKNKKWESDFSPLDINGTSSVDIKYSKAYVRHLFSARESLGPMIASLHNLAFYLWLVKEARKRILNNEFKTWKEEMLVKVSNRL